MKKKPKKPKSAVTQRKPPVVATRPTGRPAIKIKPGLALANEDLTSGALCITPFKPKLEYEWDTGQAIGHYLKYLKKGILMGRRCKNCNLVLIPPRMFCEWCFKPTAEWVPLQDIGTVETFSLCHITWNMTRLTDPQIPAVIAIDGASKGMGILHLLGEVEPRRVRIGMRVQAVWKPPAERQGAITDIKYFKPI